MRLISSAQDINVSKSPLRAGGDSGCFPNITSPVDPLSEIHSPSCITVSPITTTCIIKWTRLLLYQIALHRNSLHICMWAEGKKNHLLRIIYTNIRAPRHTAFSPTPCYNSSMGCHTTSSCQYSSSCMHASNILWARFCPYLQSHSIIIFLTDPY